MENTEVKIQERIKYMLPNLNEKQRRLFLAAEARTYGFGGVSCISRLSETSRPTIILGGKELGTTIASLPRSRKTGGGRKASYKKQPELLRDLESLVEPLAIGDPMSPLRWTVKSTRNLADELKKK